MYPQNLLQILKAIVIHRKYHRKSKFKIYLLLLIHQYKFVTS